MGSNYRRGIITAANWNSWTVSGKSGHVDIWAFAYSGGTAEVDTDYVYQRQYVSAEPQQGSWGNEEITTHAPVANFTGEHDFRARNP